MMAKLKLGGLLFVAVVIVLFVAQNTAAMNVRFLFWQISSSTATIVFLALAVGFAVGLGVGSWIAKSGAKKTEAARPHSASPES